MADQQTGLLTYLRMTPPDSPFLYTEGRRDVHRSVAELRAATAGMEDAAAEARVEGAVRDWQMWADDRLSRSVAARRPVADPTVIADDRRLFAAFTTAQQELAGRLRAESTMAGARSRLSTWVALAVAAGGLLPVAAVLAVFALVVVRQGLNPISRLAAAAEEITVEGHAWIPHLDGEDEVGQLTRALQRWQDVSAEHAVLVEAAPVGVCRVDAKGCFLTANTALETTLGVSRDQLGGRPFWTFMHPDDAERARESHGRLMRGEIDRHQAEGRWQGIRATPIWCSMVSVPVLGADARPETASMILEDVSERKQQSERAARIQSDLLPGEAPRLEGYQLAAACVPALDVGGDFYDWVGPKDGLLDLTVADVMGKGVGAALVMATLRAALRNAPHELGPAARVGQASESISRGLTDEGLFVTLFHARLEVDSGVLRYVDAGHGYTAVLRADGQTLRLRSRSLPVGVMRETVYKEEQVQLQPGDTLLVYTDGLVEVGDQTVELRQLAEALEGVEGAEQMVGRLVDRVRGRHGDDVTVMLLRRLR
jgi:PAS domain S-box-containing protein